MMYAVKRLPPPDRREVEFRRSRCLATGDSSGCPGMSDGFAQAMFFLDDEDPEEFKKLLTGLHEEFKPTSLMERIQIEHLASAQWMMLRYTALQSRALRESKTLYRDAARSVAIYQRALRAAERTFYSVRRVLMAAKKPKSAASTKAA